MLEIYTLSIDYDPRTSITQQFFKTVQNKMHFAAHGHTAAEVIYDRANAEKDFMGLTSWRGAMPNKLEAETSNNYLTEEEVGMLNRIVNLYLDFAELQAKSHVPMYMGACQPKLHGSKPMRNTTNSTNGHSTSYLRSKSTSSKPLKPNKSDSCRWSDCGPL